MANKEGVEGKPLISVIVSIYKVEKYLRKCVDSILAQTYTNLEIILVDDGSPDSCGKICDEYAEEDKRVRVIHQANAGSSGARNSGLDIANGEYIGFVDSDDYVAKTMYETLISAIHLYDADLAICRYISVNELDERLPQYDLPGNKVYNAAQVFDKFCFERMGLPYFICPWNKLYRKELFNNMRYVKGVYCQDLLIMPYIINKSSKIVALEDELYFYLVRKDNITNTRSMKYEIDEVQAWLSLYNFLKDRNMKPAATLQAAAMRLSRAYSWIGADDRQKLFSLYKMTMCALCVEIRDSNAKSKIQCLAFYITLGLLKRTSFHVVGLAAYSLLNMIKSERKKRELR